MARKIENVPREIFDASRTKRAKYQDLVVGQEGWWPLLHHEFVTILASRCPGALGLWLRARLYPSLLGACGRNVFFGQDVVLRHPHKIRIGNNVVIDDGCVLDAKGTTNDGITIGDGVFVGRQTTLATKDGAILLEDGVNIGALCAIYSASRVVVGHDTLVAAYTYLVGAGHDMERLDVAVIDQPRPSRGIVIGPNSWIGAAVQVLDGTVLGRDVIVGANAVVTGDLPDYAIAAGVPARVVRLRHEARSSSAS